MNDALVILDDMDACLGEIRDCWRVLPAAIGNIEDLKIASLKIRENQVKLEMKFDKLKKLLVDLENGEFPDVFNNTVTTLLRCFLSFSSNLTGLRQERLKTQQTHAGFSWCLSWRLKLNMDFLIYFEWIILYLNNRLNCGEKSQADNKTACWIRV